MTIAFRTEIITQIDNKLISAWKALWERSKYATIYNSYEWFNAVLSISKNKQYRLYACFANDRLVAIAPLQQYRYYGIPVWGIMCKERNEGTPFLLESTDKEIISHFFNALRSHGPIFLQKVEKTLATKIQQHYPDMLYSLMSVNPIITLEGNPFATTSQSLVKQVTKLLKKENHITFSSFQTDLHRHFRKMLSLQRNTEKAAKAMDIFTDTQTKAYYKSLIDHCGKFVRINFLYINRKPIGYEYGFLYKKTYIGDQIAFHKEYKQYFPGKVLMYHLITNLHEQQLQSFDQGGGISNYKMLFTKDYHLFYNISYSNNKMIMLWWKTINTLRRLNQLLHPKKYTRDQEFLFKTLQ